MMAHLLAASTVYCALGQTAAEEATPEDDEVSAQRLESSDEDQAIERERAARLEFLKQIADEFTLAGEVGSEKPIRLGPQPILRYSNPVRNSLSDGATFLWLEGDRPVAVAAISIRGNGQVFREFTSLVNRPLQCTHEDRTVWSPTQGGMLHEPFHESPPVAGSKRQRLTQMRRLAARFSGTYVDPRTDEAFELRLLSQPVYRYSEDSAGITDAAVFGFVEANDPELLLIIEAGPADPDTSTLTWRYSLARMTSVKMTVKLDGQEVWTVLNYWMNPKSTNDPYVEAYAGKYENQAQLESEQQR